MCIILSHRGLDEGGMYVNGHVGLGHRRLSIIDLVSGQQPMKHARQDIYIVFNGEIYNFPQLRQALENSGDVFHTTSDTEVILHLYDHYGTDCVSHLRGMFAFAIWDERRQRLMLACDRVGQKPLFYWLTANAITFASEIKAILQDENVTPEINLTGLSYYLTYQYVPAPETMFAGIHKLPPAHILIYESGAVRIERYWRLSYFPKRQIDEREAVEQAEGLLQEAVKMRMISDVPIGVFLSGGIDSSLIVALMAQYSAQPLNTFSIGFQEEGFNELPYARKVAERFHTAHHEWVVTPNALEILPKLIWHVDEPFADPAAIPTYYLAQMTGQHVKVALNGDGGDESFAGYVRYLAPAILKYYGKLPALFRKAVMSPLLHTLNQKPALFPARMQTLLRRVRFLNELSFQPPHQQYARTLTIFQEPLKRDLLSNDISSALKDLDALDYLHEYLNDDEYALSSMDKQLYADVMTYLPGDLLVKIDRMTMAHGVEGRSPFLDHVLMEFAATLPEKLKCRRMSLKYLLKKIGLKYLPPDILSRPKHGFSVPIGRWLRRELREMSYDLLTASRLAQAGIFQQHTLQRLWQEHQSGQQNHQYRLWTLLILELWYRTFITHD